MISGLPPVLGIAVLMVVGMAAGALLLAGPAFLRLRFGVDEVVTTLLLNFVVILFVGLMIEGPLRDPLAFGWPQSVPVDGDFRLPDLVPAHAAAHRAAHRACGGGGGLADPRAHRLRDGGAGRRVQRARGGVRGRVPAAHDHGRWRFCRAGSPGWRAPSR
jgi:hypothetical protein